jgi:hypothetical protein
MPRRRWHAPNYSIGESDMGLRLIDNAGRDFHRLWSMRVAIFFFVLNGALLGLAAFSETLNPLLFLALNMFGYGLQGIMRMLKQAPKAEAGADQ